MNRRRALKLLAAVPALLALPPAHGIFDTEDFVWNAVEGDQIECVFLYRDANGWDVWHIDRGMPPTPNGGTLDIKMNAGGVFTLET